MYMVDYELRSLEDQLHGYDAALGEARLLNGYERFNAALTTVVMQATGASGVLGWAAALERLYGTGEPAFTALVSLLNETLSLAIEPK